MKAIFKEGDLLILDDATHICFLSDFFASQCKLMFCSRRRPVRADTQQLS